MRVKGSKIHPRNFLGIGQGVSAKELSWAVEGSEIHSRGFLGLRLKVLRHNQRSSFSHGSKILGMS